MTRTRIAPSKSTASKISPVRAGVKYGSDTRTNAPPMRIAASPAQKQASLIHQAIWWRGDGQPAFNWNGSAAGDMEKAVQTIVHLATISDEALTPSLPATNAKRLRKGGKATRQSNFPLCRAMDCFASLAMTV
jgi:hypothetical protein